MAYGTKTYGYVPAESGPASLLKTLSGTVRVSNSLSPTAGQILTATSTTNAVWATPVPVAASLSATLAVGNTTGANDIAVQQQLQLPVGAATNTTNLLNVTSGAGAPTSAGVREGSLYYDTTGNALYVYDTVSGWILPASSSVGTIAQVLTVGNTAIAGQQIDMGGGIRLTGNGINDANNNATLIVFPAAVASVKSIQLQSGTAAASITATDTSNPALDTDLDIAPGANGDVNFLTTATGQVHTSSYYSSDKQTRVGVSRLTNYSVPPGPDTAQTIPAGATVRVQVAKVLFDDNVDGIAYADLINNRITIPGVASTWMISANLVGEEEGFSHSNMCTMKLSLKIDDGVNVSEYARDAHRFPPEVTGFACNLCVILNPSLAGPNRVYCDLTNNSDTTVRIETYRLRAARIN